LQLKEVALSPQIYYLIFRSLSNCIS